MKTNVQIRQSGVKGVKETGLLPGETPLVQSETEEAESTLTPAGWSSREKCSEKLENGEGPWRAVLPSMCVSHQLWNLLGLSESCWSPLMQHHGKGTSFLFIDMLDVSETQMTAPPPSLSLQLGVENIEGLELGKLFYPQASVFWSVN